MGEITHLASAANGSVHEQLVYKYFAAMEKYTHTTIPRII